MAVLAWHRLPFPSWPWHGGESTPGFEETSVINVQGDQSFIARIFIYVEAEEYSAGTTSPRYFKSHLNSSESGVDA
jgi:hypothetical protein